jgi:hypothetical protein
MVNRMVAVGFCSQRREREKVGEGRWRRWLEGGRLGFVPARMEIKRGGEGAGEDGARWRMTEASTRGSCSPFAVAVGGGRSGTGRCWAGMLGPKERKSGEEGGLLWWKEKKGKMGYKREEGPMIDRFWFYLK